MTYQEIRADIFSLDVQTLVNTVNCKGAMGRGIALEMKKRFPKMFEHYKRYCDNGDLRPGMTLPYRPDTGQWILNMAIKDHWKDPARMEWIERCLEKFSNYYQHLGITSVAFPHMGRANGWLPWPPLLALMRQYLLPIGESIDVYLVEFPGQQPDLENAGLRQQYAQGRVPERGTLDRSHAQVLQLGK